MLEIKNVSKIYNSTNRNKFVALKNISFNLPSKGLVFIYGKSGSGKSTLLNLLGGLDKIDNGEIIVDGNSLNDFKNKDFDIYRNSYVGFVFQNFCLIENYTVFDNVKLSLDLGGGGQNLRIKS